MLLTLLPAAALAADETGGTTTSSGIELSKTATLEDDGTYTINLEAYATGETTTTTTTSGVPLDIVLVIDQSGSMANSITSVSGYTARTSQAYTYQGYGNNTYYYLAEDGNYYAVSRGSQRQNQGGGGGGGNNSYYYLYYTDANGNTVYLSGTGTTTTQPTNVTDQNNTIWTGVLYSATTTSVTKLEALQTAVTSFVNAISANAASTGADHRIAIAGFACGDNSDMSGYQNGSWNWLNTGLFIGGSLTNYATQGSTATTSSLTAQNYQDALVSVNDENGNVASSITTAISNFKAEGATFTSYGMEMANNVFANNSATYTKDDGTEGTRQRIVVVFTDGAPGYSGYTDAEAGAAVNYSYTAKNTYSATVYTVGLYASSDETDNVKAFMNYLSSNYPSAQYSNNSWSAGTQASSKYYMTTNDATELNNIFTTISSEATSSSTTVTLDENSVMKDIMGDGFTLTSDSTVTIKTVSGSVDADSGEIKWGEDTETSKSASYTISDDKTTVSVTGFDYAANYISSGHSGEKICVTITGILPTTDVTTDEAVNTNAATSGIYATADATEATATFEQPQTIITKKLYVLDYAKAATLSDLDQNSVTGIVDTYKKVSSTDNALTQAYGTSALSGSTLTYTPTTTNWNGYDSLYVFGQTTNTTVTALEANSNGNLWSKVSVIPANNVYYEDDFITTSTDGSTSTGTVGIVYTGDWTTVSGNTSTSGNTETANNETYGWVESLSDDDTYSDGTAMGSGTAGAKATFTFTGTGVDIYSRTDMVSGQVIVKVKSDDASYSYTYICNDLSTTAVYYQIPTVCINDLDYDTYTVTITVATNGSTTGETYTYYLDGIRVYNPLGTVGENDGDAYEAYKDDNELNAVFTEVRSILIDAESFTADYDGAGGVVFIDDNLNNGTAEEGETETEHSTSVIGTYYDYGPENEVYLAAGQSIAFKVNTEFEHFYLGLKSADGLGTTATVTDGSTTKALTIKHSTDLYYEITPTDDGYILVKNTGSNLLSITKLRATSATAVDTSENVSDGESGIALLSADEVDEIMVYAASFDSLQSVASTDTGVEEDSFVDTEIDTETDVDTETGDVVEDLDEDDIEIDNPTDDTEEEQEEASSSQSSFSNLFNSIRNWFNGRR